ncbi:MAG: hypothetical protein Kow0080_36940 [Candidatus Promineifilaceae bacterium]
MWFALGLLILWTAVTLTGIWLLNRLFPAEKRPSPPQANDPMNEWQALYQRGEISAETLALLENNKPTNNKPTNKEFQP